MLKGIPFTDIDGVWTTVSPWVQQSIDKSQHDYELDDILFRLYERDMQLWVWYEEEEIVACCVTTIIKWPRKKICSMPIIGGKAMNKWLTPEVEELFVQWAREQGCSQMEGYCRDGWLRLLPHWNKVWTTMRRSI